MATYTLQRFHVYNYDWILLKGKTAHPVPTTVFSKLSPRTVMLFAPFRCTHAPTSPCPTLSAHSEPISKGHCWR